MLTDDNPPLATDHVKWWALPSLREVFVFCMVLLLASTGATFAAPILQIKASYDPDKCLDIFGGLPQPNYGVDLFTCTPGDPHESFAFQKLDGGHYKIMPQNGAILCLDANGIAVSGGTQVVQNTCSESRSQEWNVHENADGSFSILTADGMGALEVQGMRATTNRTPILVGPLDNASENRFLISGFTTQDQARLAPPIAGDRTIGPAYFSDPYLLPRPEVPKGKLIGFVMKSAESRYFPGNAPVTGPFKRAVWVYVPQQYARGKDVPFMVVQDASYRPLLTTLLDNAIYDKKLPVMVIVFANNGGGGKGIGIAHDQGTERNLEYDTVSPLYAEWVENELLPRVEAQSRLQIPDQALTLTSDPAGRGTIGCSSGAAAAFTMAWFEPRSFTRVLSYSGSYTNLQYPTDPAYPHGAWSYPERLVREEAKRPIRIWMEVGTQDMDWSQWGDFLDWQAANRKLAAALAYKSYQYHFDLAQGAHHCDGRVPAQTLAEAMEWLWQGYPIH